MKEESEGLILVKSELRIYQQTSNAISEKKKLDNLVTAARRLHRLNIENKSLWDHISDKVIDEGANLLWVFRIKKDRHLPHHTPIFINVDKKSKKV